MLKTSEGSCWWGLRDYIKHAQKRVARTPIIVSKNVFTSLVQLNQNWNFNLNKEQLHQICSPICQTVWKWRFAFAICIQWQFIRLLKLTLREREKHMVEKKLLPFLKYCFLGYKVHNEIPMNFDSNNTTHFDLCHSTLTSRERSNKKLTI